MSDKNCAIVRGLIPEFVIGRLGEHEIDMVECHISECPSCRGELKLVQMIFVSRPKVPATQTEVVTRRVIDDLRIPFRARHTLSAAAIAALALGVGIASNPPTDVAIEVPSFAYEIEAEDVWLIDDALVAGAPSFEDLSDEALSELIEELSVGTSGGTV